MSSSDYKKRIAIIGAGVSGLPVIKTVLKENMIPVCFERTVGIGGLWNYTPELMKDGHATVMRSTVASTSKERMAYSDFPVPDHFPNFMHNTKVLEYFHLYAKEFNLLKYINFNTEVVKADPMDDFDDTGRWNVRVKDRLSNEVKAEVFDGVMVCTGHHAHENIPTLPGSEVFKGKHLHSRDYKDYQGFENKRVVVIGLGNSGGDIAVELGICAKQVYLSTRRGAWVRNRLCGRGLPYDMIGSRFTWSCLMSLPEPILNHIMMQTVNKNLDHTAYGLKPDHPVNAQQCMINDDLPIRLINGSITLKHGVERLTETGVEFDDGTFEDNIDVVIYATGYLFKFPFIDKDIFKVTKNKVKLYKFIFPPNLKPSTLAFIGCFQPVGSMMPLCEMQCRWATRVLKGTLGLPSSGKMWEDITAKDDAMKARYVESLRHTIQVDWIPYFDEIAELVGCKPNFKDLWTKDPKLAYHVYFGSVTPYQYRLFGPHRWPGARKAILTTWNRVYAPLQTRKLAPEKSWGFFRYTLIVILVYVFFALLIF